MKFSLPVNEKRITSPFGQRGSEFHNGIDLGVPAGSDVKAAASGIVLSTYNDSLGGNQMILLHNGGWKTGYAHLNSFLANPGDEVGRGDTIALSGATGETTGPHLHFTVTNPSGEKIDPETVLGSNWIKWTAAGAALLLLVLLIFLRRKKII